MEAPSKTDLKKRAWSNRWALGYIAAVSTLGVVIQIVNGVRGT